MASSNDALVFIKKTSKAKTSATKPRTKSAKKSNRNAEKHSSLARKRNREVMGDNINMYLYSSACSSSSDDMSHFVRQILVRSSSLSSSSPMATAHAAPQARSGESPYLLSRSAGGLRQGISAVDCCDGGSSGSGVGFSGNVRGSGASSSVGASENDIDEYDCESEERLEAVVEDAPAKAAPPRSSSKRSRAAEVHNLSEKRRRSRINEKMKALQNLIPNSNKTDKASMLDEAIEYLKQLQLQVQMLSMRNGISLHPLCLPGMLQPIQLSPTKVDFDEDNGSLHMDLSGTIPLNRETSAQTAFSMPNQCSTSNHHSIPNMSSIINSGTSFGLESSIRSQFGPFQILTPSADICREDVLSHHQLNMNLSKTSTSEFETGTTTTVSLPFDTQESDLKQSASLAACMIGGDQSEGMLLKNIERNLVLSPHLTGMEAGRSAVNDIKTERPNF